MKALLFAIPLILNGSVFAGTNLSDAIDANEIPAHEEQREQEVINLPDSMDKNANPSTLEARERDEKWRKDYQKIQKDMPRMNKKRQ